MYPAKVLPKGPLPGSQPATIDEMIIAADGFVGVFPEHKYEIVKHGTSMPAMGLLTHLLYLVPMLELLLSALLTLLVVL